MFLSYGYIKKYLCIYVNKLVPIITHIIGALNSQYLLPASLSLSFLSLNELLKRSLKKFWKIAVYRNIEK